MYAQLQQVALLLTAQTPPEGQPGWGSGDLLLPVVLFSVFYFLVIRPGSRDRKKHQAMLDALKRGDEVVTNAGMLGTVADIDPSIITLEVARNVKIRVLKSVVQKRVVDEKKPSESNKHDKKSSKS